MNGLRTPADALTLASEFRLIYGLENTGRLGDAWYLDEVFITIQGEQHYLWRAVDQDGDTIDILVQRRRNKTSCCALLSAPTQRPRPLATMADDRQITKL